MTNRSMPAVFVLLLSAAACGGDSGGWTGTMTDSAGVTIVMNPQAGVWSASETPRVDEELTIGRADGDVNYQFGQIAGIDVGADGSIYVLDQQARNIRVFDQTGTFQRAFGRPGSGPGELSAQTFGVVVTAGDTVLVPDLAQQRVTRFTAGGETIGSFPTPFSQGIPVRWAVGPDGRIVQQSRIMKLPGSDSTVRNRDLLFLRNAQGELLDTLLELPAGKTLEMSGGTMKIRFFEAEPVWGLGDNGSVFYGVNSDYSILVHDRDGNVRRIVRRAVERKPVTEADQTAFRNAMRDLFGRQGLPPQALDQIMAGMSFAEFYPAFANLMGGPANSLWVQRIRTASDLGEGVAFDLQDSGSPEWDIFGTDGRYLGVIRMPDRFTPLRVIGDQIYGIWRDDLDVQYVKRVRVDMAEAPVPAETQP